MPACKFSTKLSSYPLTYASQPYLVGSLGGSEGVMPYRVNPLVSAAFIGSLAAAMFLCPNWAAWAAGNAFQSQIKRSIRPAHWYYYVDRVHHRRCWFFESSKATVSPASSAARAPAPNTDSQQSWFSRFAADVAKTFSSEPQQTSISAFSSEAAAKIVYWTIQAQRRSSLRPSIPTKWQAGSGSQISRPRLPPRAASPSNRATGSIAAARKH